VLPSKAATLRSLYPYAPGWGDFCPGYNTSQNCSDSAPWGLRFLNPVRGYRYHDV
jgi:hypothetical protein